MTAQELSSLIKQHPDISGDQRHNVTKMFLTDQMQFNMYWLTIGILHEPGLKKNKYTLVENWIGTDSEPA